MPYENGGSGRPRGRPKQGQVEEDVARLIQEPGWLQTLFERGPNRISECVKAEVKKHLRGRPFDLLRYGAFKITDKHGKLVWFNLWPHQERILRHVEDHFYRCQAVRVIHLKPRQVGGTTGAMGFMACLLLAFPGMNWLIMTDRKDKAEEHRDKIVQMLEGLPGWLAPLVEKKGKKIIVSGGLFSDNEQPSAIFIDSAESKDGAAFGLTYGGGNLSECSRWPVNYVIKLYSSCLDAFPQEWPSFVMEETTGERLNDMFSDRYFAAKGGEKGRLKSFFCPWMDHPEYETQFEDWYDKDKWDDPEHWWDYVPQEYRQYLGNLRNHDGTTVRLTQCHWWYTKLQESASIERMKCQYPSSDLEAFMGGSSNFFNLQKVARDANRCSVETIVPLDQLPDSATVGFLGDNPKVVARCSLVYTKETNCKDAKFVDDAKGDWFVYERPRFGHSYITSGDPVTGKQAVKDSDESKDFAVLSAYRYTFEPTERMTVKEVAMLRRKGIGPTELGRAAVGLSWAFSNKHRQQAAFLIFDAHAHGIAFGTEAEERNHGNIYHRTTQNTDTFEVQKQLGYEWTGTGEGSKSVACNKLRDQWNDDLFELSSEIAVQELGSFCDINGKLKAAGQHKDDTVTTASLALQALIQLTGSASPVQVDVTRTIRDHLATLPTDGHDLDDIPEPPLAKPRGRMALIEVGGQNVEDQSEAWGV